jgi:hypothetical protein
MTNKTFRMLLKAIAAFAITAAFGSASFAGDFTVREGKRYCATLSLNSVERLADNALIARKFRALGFSKVRVSGAGPVRRVEGVWHRKVEPLHFRRNVRFWHQADLSRAWHHVRSPPISGHAQSAMAVSY